MDSVATIQAAFESGTKYLATYTDDDGTAYPWWTDVLTDSELFETEGAAYIYAATWGLGACTIVTRNFSVVRGEEVIA